jgi:Ran-binding protein 3
MQSDGGWKERGVGALKLNVRESDGKGPRLGASFLLLLLLLFVLSAKLEKGS